MAYKLIDAAQARWRAVTAPHLAALVRAGARFTRANSLNASITDIAPPKATTTEVQTAGSEVA